MEPAVVRCSGLRIAESLSVNIDAVIEKPQTFPGIASSAFFGEKAHLFVAACWTSSGSLISSLRFHIPYVKVVLPAFPA